MEKCVFAELSANLAMEMEQVTNLIMQQICPTRDYTLIQTITDHITNAGGKKLRPMLTLASARLCGNISEHHIMLAASVELIHTATLLHDDVIDQSILRRGSTTANALWGNKASILAGDYLFSHSFKFMVKTKLMQALTLLADVASTIAEAEILQLQLIGNINVTQTQYLDLITAKTASLFSAACAVGGIANDIAIEKRDALYRYGLSLGIVFQLIDDLLDYTGNSSEFGKKLGSDLLESKPTLPLLVLYELASKAEQLQIEYLFRAQDVAIIEQHWDMLLHLVKKYNIHNIIITQALQIAQSGIIALEQFPESMYKTLLKGLLLDSVKRKR